MLYRVLHSLRMAYFSVVQTKLQGTRVIALTPDNHIILLRHTYGSSDWMLPGGGLSAKDTPEAGALRELREETGMTSHGAVSYQGFYNGKMGRADDGTHLFVVRDVVYKLPRFSFEIASVQAFALNALPPDISQGTMRRIAEWQGQRPIQSEW